jgi:hypothetical protein
MVAMADAREADPALSKEVNCPPPRPGPLPSAFTAPRRSVRRDRSFGVEFDFCQHKVDVRTNEGESRSIALKPGSVADFYREFIGVLDSLRVAVKIWPMPVEIAGETTPLDVDRKHASYDPLAVERWWQIITYSARIFERFRTEFIGKCSPVNFYWGALIWQ